MKIKDLQDYKDDNRSFEEIIEAGLKVGQRNSEGDQRAIQSIHDTSATLGAECVGKSPIDMEKVKALIAKEVDAKFATVGGAALVANGGEVKSLETTVESLTVGGYLVLFSDETTPDLTKDYFTKETNFGPHNQTPVFYGHGGHPNFGKQIIGVGELAVDDTGVFIQAELDLRKKYVAQLQKLLDENALGWSSGTAPHLVIREKKDSGVSEIKQWILGIDATLTPIPAEPRTLATQIKSTPKDEVPVVEEEETKQVPAGEGGDELHPELLAEIQKMLDGYMEETNE